MKSQFSFFLDWNIYACKIDSKFCGSLYIFYCFIQGPITPQGTGFLAVQFVDGTTVNISDVLFYILCLRYILNIECVHDT